MIIPGILEETFEQIKQKADLIDGHAKLIQVDVADGKLVEGQSFQDVGQFNTLKAQANIEIHLMVEDPYELVLKLEKVKRFVSQVESDQEKLQDFIDKSKSYGYETGLSISPDTPNHFLDPYLEQIHYVQFMGVVPGAQSRAFEPKVLEKIKEFKLSHPQIPIQVDGHMNEKTIQMIKPLKVDNFVVGSDIFKDADPINKLKELQKLCLT